jgi:hypothetical protein
LYLSDCVMDGDRIGERDQQRAQRGICVCVPGSDLGLEEARQKEGMVGQFDDLDRPVVRIAADDQTSPLQNREQVLIRAVATEVIAKHRLLTANGARFRPGDRAHHATLTNQGAGKRHDDRCPAGVNLCMSGIDDPGDVPGVLHEHVLKATSGAEEGNARLACVSNHTQSAFEASIRAPRRHPDTVDATKPSSRIGKLVSRYPVRRDAVR